MIRVPVTQIANELNQMIIVFHVKILLSFGVKEVTKLRLKTCLRCHQRHRLHQEIHVRKVLHGPTLGIGGAIAITMEIPIGVQMNVQGIGSTRNGEEINGKAASCIHIRKLTQLGRIHFM